MQTKKRAKPVKFGKPTKSEEVKLDKLAAKQAAEADMNSPETEELKKIVEERIHEKEEAPTEDHVVALEEEPMEVKLSEDVDEEEMADLESKEPSIEEEEKKESKPEIQDEVKEEVETKEQVEESAKTSQYGSFTNDSKEEVKKKNNYVGLFFLVAFVTFIVGLAFIAGISYTMSLTSKNPITIPSLQKASPTPTNEPVSPTPAKVDLSAYSIKVLNGSGTTGEAAKAKTTLTDAGFTVSSVGNASTSDYTLTVISAKKNVSEAYLNKLTDALKKKYSVNSVVEEAPASQSTDVLVTVGSDSAK